MKLVLHTEMFSIVLASFLMWLAAIVILVLKTCDDAYPIKYHIPTSNVASNT